MTSRDHEHIELEDFALELGHTAGGIAKAYFRSSFAVDNKDERGFDPVTSADRAIESVLRKAIRERYPDHGIVAEEEGVHEAKSAFTWYIDPIDGTRSFMTGSPLWGTLVGLLEHEQPIFGLLVQPILEEVFLGSPTGSWLIKSDGRRRLEASHCAEIGKATLTTTHPSLFQGSDSERFGALADRCLLTRYGGDCYNYAMVAAGFVDLVVECGLNPYDIVPLIPILEGAGCIVTDWDGNRPLAGGRVIAAAGARLHEHALAVLAA